MTEAAEQYEREFALESPEPGKVPDNVIAHLRALRKRAKEAGWEFKEAIKVQAEKFDVAPGALRSYVVGLEDDTLSELAAEAADLERLIG
jgi:hypothetical protein